MSAVQKDTLPPSYNPEKDSVNMFYQLIIIIKKKPPVFFLQLFIKCLQKPDSESVFLSNFCFYQCKCFLVCYWRVVQKQLGCWHSSYSFIWRGFVLSTKTQIQRSFMDLKSILCLITSLHWGPKAFALKQNYTQAAFPNKHTQASATGWILAELVLR